MAENIQHSADEKKENRRLLSSLAVVIILVALLALVGFLFLKEPPEIIEGQADATSVRVSGMLPGRVTEFMVKEGDMVHAGDTLVHIHSSLAEARLAQAQYMVDAAQAVNRKVDSGTRSQIIQGAYQLWQQAKAAVDITGKTYERMQNLYAKGVVSEQKRDEAKAAYDAAVAAEKAAESQYSLAKQGAQSEDKQSASAMVGAAESGVAEVNALLEDQYLTAPCDGQVDIIYPHVGELVSIGAPVMNLLRTDDKWVTFNVREDLLSDITMGKKIKVMIPALDRKEIDVEVFYIRDMGSYATWRATKSTGDWDSRTFQIKARPLEDIPNLRPGMTVIYR
ncbi:MAG: HlyD family efflux transporter periplasmic adaptor subunit [Muribaculaceae bacterium]|nr:HlyD family efflux transporter periplasmic adaptor subunit [Muribaculaceae bacterium]